MHCNVLPNQSTDSDDKIENRKQGNLYMNIYIQLLTVYMLCVFINSEAHKWRHPNWDKGVSRTNKLVFHFQQTISIADQSRSLFKVGAYYCQRALWSAHVVT